MEKNRIWNFFIFIIILVFFWFIPNRFLNGGKNSKDLKLPDNFFVSDVEAEIIVLKNKIKKMDSNNFQEKKIKINILTQKEKEIKREMQKKDEKDQNFIKKILNKFSWRTKKKIEKKKKYPIEWEIVNKWAEVLGYEKRKEIESYKLANFNSKRKLEVNTLSSLKAMFFAIEKEEGVKMNLVSAFRSYNDQKIIFEYKYYKKCLGKKTDECISEIIKILNYSSPPGYSKHHTGQTVDLACGESKKLTDSFRYTECYKWLSKNNFENAKRFHFYSSYPYGKKRTGPVPEPWEFIHKEN